MSIELVSEPSHEACCAHLLRRLYDLVGPFICHLRALWTWLTCRYTPRTPYLSSRQPLPDCEKGWPVDDHQTRAQLLDALKRRDAADAAFEAQVAALLGPVKQRLAEITRDRGALGQVTLDEEPAPDLPPAPQIFYGRARQLDVLVDMFVPPRQARVALLGEAGAGTSALALALLHRAEITRAFGARRFLVRRGDTLAAVLGLDPDTPLSAVMLALAACPRRTLLALDDLQDDTFLTTLSDMPRVSLVLCAHTTMHLVSWFGTGRTYTILPVGPLPLPAARALFRAIADLPASSYDDHTNNDVVPLVCVPRVADAPIPVFPPSETLPQSEALFPLFETPPPGSGSFATSVCDSDDAALVDALLQRTRYLPREIVHLAQRAQYEPLPFLLASCVEEGDSGV